MKFRFILNCFLYFLPIPLFAQAELQKNLTQLSVDLSMLADELASQSPKSKKYVFTGRYPFENHNYTYIIYTLENGKKIRVEVNDITKLNEFDTIAKQFVHKKLKHQTLVAGDPIKVDAIVNAANEQCLGGGGIDGAIHTSINAALNVLKQPAKYKFRDICANLPLLNGNRCITGGAKIVPGVTLAKYIVQAVGPRGNTPNKEFLLESTYRNSLEVASQSSETLAQLFDLKNNDAGVSNREIYQYYGILEPVDYGIKTIAFPSISTGIFGYPKDDAAERAINTVYEFLNNEQTPIEEVRFVMYTPGNVEETKNDYNRYVKFLNKKLGYAEDQGLN